jgi:glyoxylase-like metal-dependent hydrolase (beta-lactamase superfamily II)
MERIGPTVYIETRYSGVNVGAIATEEGVVCIDAPSRPRDTQDWLEQIRRDIGGPIQYLVLTDYQADRAFCGSMFHSRGVAHEETRDVLYGYATRFPTPILENITLRFGLRRKQLNGMGVVKPQVSFCQQATLQFGNQRIDIYHAPGATPGTAWVYVNDDRVLFAGDTVVVDQHPPLTEAQTSRWLSALVRLKQGDLGADIIVPGRGPLPTEESLGALAKFLETAREQVCALYRTGRPRAETSSLVPDLAGFFPLPHPRTENAMEWLHRQLKAGLDHLYDQCKAGSDGR